MPEVPSGTVTLLFSDIEGSTRLWEEYPELMRGALERHDELLAMAVASEGGFVFKTVGDAFCVAFPTASAATACAVDAQRALAAESWPIPVEIRARMGLHSGECIERDNDYFGPTVNRAARLEATAHGGQIVLSATTRLLLGGAFPIGIALRDLGEHRLKDLGAPVRVFQVDVDGLRQEFPPLRSLDNPELPNNLPLYAASFVGREAELASVRELVAVSRLVTLTGPGGAGKTRLAVQVAADLLDGSGDGVWIVDFAPVTDETMVPPVIADAIGLQSGSAAGSIEGLIAALGARRLLIVVDNCEHLIDAIANAADRLIRACAGVVLLATSREPLGVAGEVVHRVPSLGLPDPFESDPDAIAQAESVRLFVERVRLHNPDFEVDAANAVSVAAVCRRLDGIPLAVELAAARLRSISADELLGRLDQRFRLLTGGSRTAMARQQTLRATIDWSFELLDARERTVLARASVFAGGWDLSAGEGVLADDGEGGAIDASDVIDVLTSLVDKSLLNVESSDITRYRMLETIREYAAEKLAGNGGDANRSLRRKHLDQYVSLAEFAAPRLRTGEQEVWLDRLEVDHENLRAALVAAGDLEETNLGLRLGIALRWYASMRKRARDLVELLTALISASESDPTLRADAQVALTVMIMDTHRYARAAATIEPAIARFREMGDRARLADALWVAGWLAIYSGDRATAETLSREGLQAALSANDPDTIARTHGLMASSVSRLDDVAAAREHFEAELAGYVDMGDRILQCMSRNNRGSMEVELRNIDAADESLEPAEAIARELHLPELLAYVLQNRGFVADLRRDDATAFARAAEALSLIHRHDIARLSSPALLGCARGLSRTNAEVSATLYGAAAAFAEDWFFLPGFTRLLAATEERLRALLGDEAYTHCCETGRALSTRELVALTRAHAPSSSSNSSVVQPAGHERPRPFPPEKSERHASGPNTEK